MNFNVVPEPKKIVFEGKWFKIDGIKNLPELISRDFSVRRGNWLIEKINGTGNGLKITAQKIAFWGDENVCYATLLQLLRINPGYLPEIYLEENFQFLFRGYHLDIARGGVPTVQTFKKILQWLFLLKYNYFAIYFEDLFPWDKYPIIGKARGRLTKKELTEIVDYGKKLGVEVMPSLELLGHMERMFALPEFAKYSEGFWGGGSLNVSDENAKKFAYELLEESLSFFNSCKYIHIGGDETWELGRGKSLNKFLQYKAPEFYLEHYSTMLDMIRKNKQVPVLWGDMISGMYLSDDERKLWKEILNAQLWNDVVIANWDYTANSEEYFINKIRLFKNQQIICPGFSNWNKYYPDFDTAIANITNFINAGKKEKVMGFLVTAWGDYGEECLFSFLDPLVLASMEIAEGNGDWENKWLSLTGENKSVLETRKMFGKTQLVNTFKPIFFGDVGLNKEEKAIWKTTLNKAEKVKLPEDLNFVYESIKIGYNKLNKKVKEKDFIKLCDEYKKLWLKERKQEGLHTNVEKFWSVAAKYHK